MADPTDLAYTTGDLSVDSGAVTIGFENPAPTGHDVRIEDSGGADVGGTSVISESSETTGLCRGWPDAGSSRFISLVVT